MLETSRLQILPAQRVLQIRPLSWTADGWPKVGEPIFEPKLRPSRSVLKTEATAGDSPAATVELGRLTSPVVIQGTNDTGYRDPAVVFHDGTFYVYMSHIRTMHGPHRITTLLKRVDQLSRGQEAVTAHGH